MYLISVVALPDVCLVLYSLHTGSYRYIVIPIPVTCVRSSTLEYYSLINGFRNGRG